MSRLHCARYTIPTHRPWWSTAWRALQLAWLRHRLDCVVDEREGYLAAGMALGEKYLANSAESERDLKARIALLEVHS